MEDPVIMINYKTYETAIGNNAVELTKQLEIIAKEENASVAVCVCPTDISAVKGAVSLPVLGEHVDGVGFGSHTGRIVPRCLKEAGAVGSLINHSEDRYGDVEKIKAAIDMMKSEGLITVVCTKDAQESAELAKLNPDYVAVEPPELIGGDISVTTANPEIVEHTVRVVKEVAPDVKVLCGAGVKTGEDVRKAIELGCSGVLLASGITKVSNPQEALKDMCSGLK